MTAALPVWRSLLYVPATIQKYIDKAHMYGADCIQLDLEDSVPESEKARVLEAIEIGVSDYLVKPFTAEVLRKKLERFAAAA